MMLRSVVAKVHPGIGSSRSFSDVPTQRNGKAPHIYVEEARLGVSGWIISKTIGITLGVGIGHVIFNVTFPRSELGKKKKELEKAYKDLAEQTEEADLDLLERGFRI